MTLRSPDDALHDGELPPEAAPNPTRRPLTPEETSVWIDPLIEGKLSDFRPERLEDPAARAEEEAKGDAAFEEARFRDALRSYMLAGAREKLVKFTSKLMRYGGHLLQVRDAALLAGDHRTLAYCAHLFMEDGHFIPNVRYAIDIYEYLKLPGALDELAVELDKFAYGQDVARLARQTAARIRAELTRKPQKSS